MQSARVAVWIGSAIAPVAIKIVLAKIRVGEIGVAKIRVGVAEIRVGVAKIRVGVAEIRRGHTSMVVSRRHGGVLGVETIGIIFVSMLTIVSTIRINVLSIIKRSPALPKKYFCAMF